MPMNGIPQPDKPKPGRQLEQVIQRFPIQKHPAFLDHLERKYRAAADLDMLREIKAYRQLAAQAPLRVK